MVLKKIQGRIPNAFDDPARRGPQPDILAEERARRSGKGWRLGRFYGKLVMFGVAGFMVAAVSFLVYQGSTGEGRMVATRFSPVEVDNHPEMGRDLIVVERVRVAHIGKPLYLGPSGLPVVEHHVTGEVREVTPVEIDYWEKSGGADVPYLESGTAGLLWNPGPSGWGMWWRDDSEAREILPDLYYEREGWLDRQVYELERVAYLLSVGMRVIDLFDYELWNKEPSSVLAIISQDLQNTHPVVSEHGIWAAVPGQWVCDEQLEMTYNLYATQGCPPGPYMTALMETWIRVGVLADQMEEIAQLGLMTDGMRLQEIENTTVIRDMVYLVMELIQDADILIDTFDSLRRVTHDYELPISVYLFRGV